MKKQISIIGLVPSLFFLPALTFSASAAKPVPPSLTHDDKITAYEGPSTCFSCHPGTIADEIFNSVHFQVRSENSLYDIPGGGSHGMLDRACGLPGSSLMAGNWAGTANAPDGLGGTRDDGCGKCHIAYKPPPAYQTAADALPDIDCLRCHAQVYGDEWNDPEVIAEFGTNPDIQERHVVTDPEGNKFWSQDRSLKTAQTVSALPGGVTSHACLRCHEHGLSGYKRATPFEPDTDLHANKGIECTDCHTVSAHKIARGNYVTDGMANEMPEVEVACTNCHDAATPHSQTNAAELNLHVTNVSCEVCHINKMEVTNRNIFKRAWSPFTTWAPLPFDNLAPGEALDPSTLQWDATPPITTGLEYPGYWDAHTEYHPDGSSEPVRPTVRWFNGGASLLAQPYGDYGDRRSNGGDARLFSFKPFISGMLFDAGIFANQVDANGTRAFSMKWLYDNNWDTYCGMKMVDCESYPTSADYWTARPDMAMAMNKMPMMLYFNRVVFMEEGGNVVGSPTPGPQNASTYPGIANAINTGMGSMGIAMGLAPQGSDPVLVGQQMWSGSFFSMWVPDNMDPSSNFFGEVASYITLSHAVTSNSSTVLSYCTECHFSQEEYDGTIPPDGKYLDFTELNFPDLDGNGLSDPMYDQAP